MNCVICDSAMNERGVCPACGFDEGRNLLSHPSLAAQVPSDALRTLRKAWARKNEGKLQCPRCGRFAFSLLTREKALDCTGCGYRMPRRELAGLLGFMDLGLPVQADWPVGGASAPAEFARETAATPPETEEGGRITWGIDRDSGELVISGSGAMENYLIGKAPWNSYRWTIRRIVVEEGVTGIGSYAFYGCSKLTELVLPRSLRRIGDNAFGYCPKLAALSLPDQLEEIGENAFKFCSALEELALPASLKLVRQGAFLSCVNLKRLTVSPRDLRIKNGAFSFCTQLAEVVFGGTRQEWERIVNSREDDGLAHKPVRCLA